MARLIACTLGLMALSSLACGGAAPPPARTTAATLPSAAAPSRDGDLAVLREREATTSLKDYRVRAADGVIELHVKAVAPPVVKTRRVRDEVLTTVEFSMGGDVDVSCHASKTPIDFGHWVAAIIGAVHARLRGAPTLEVEAHEGHPLLLVETDAILAHEGRDKAHFAKFAGTHLEQGSVACVHDGLGFHRTFREVAAHIAARSVSPGAEPPSFREISIARDGDRVMGFEETRAWLGDKPGASRQQTLSSAILTHDDKWAPADAAWVGVVDTLGVVRERSMRRVGASTVVDMTLERKRAGFYTYEGTVKGAPVKGTFKSREAVVTRLSRGPALAAFMRNERKALSFSYFDESEPAHAIKETVRREGAAQVRFEEPARQVHCVVDAQGLCTRTWREGAAWSTERIFSAGRL
ncbi:MAG: hypothetical protein KF819_00850 [Labilithrix sp.]|nr:hypothetical protein [Labilithrix sp.]